MEANIGKALPPLTAQESLAIRLSVIATDAVAMEDAELITTCREIIELMTPRLDQSNVALFDSVRAYVDICSARLANPADTANIEQQTQLRAAPRGSINGAAVIANA